MAQNNHQIAIPKSTIYQNNDSKVRITIFVLMDRRREKLLAMLIIMYLLRVIVVMIICFHIYFSLSMEKEETETKEITSEEKKQLWAAMLKSHA